RISTRTFFSLTILPPPRSTLFPYTTLFRSVLIVTAVAFICYIGIRQSSAINSAIVVLKICVVLGFVLLGAGFVTPANWHPFVPADRKSTRLNSSHVKISYAVFCLKKKTVLD